MPESTEEGLTNRASLDAWWGDKVWWLREALEDAELMRRTIQYLDDPHVALELATRPKLPPTRRPRP